MYLLTIIGATGSGKSPFVRKYISGKRCFVWDYQNEYGLRTKYPGQKPVNLPLSGSRSRYVGTDRDEFIELCRKKKNTICVFEEATMFFEGHTSENMRQLIFGKFHTGNIYLLIFHSINSVPPRLMEGTDYVILFKTGDERDNVKRKFSKLLPAFDTIQKYPERSPVKIKTI